MPAGEIFTLTTAREVPKKAKENNELTVTRGKQKEYQLIKVKDTWCRVESGQEIACDWEEDPIIVSQAKISEKISESGVSWTVQAPIYFRYKVIETQSLLDPSNSTLLYGHVSDPQELEVYQKKTQRRFIVIDVTVDKLHGSKVRKYFEANNVHYKVMALPTTEETKSMDMVLKILEEVQKFGLDRRTEPIIAIGGGVCLDIVGLAASLYRRRTPYIRIPTTLLSYVDASVGAKNGVNFCNCKNKLGSYTPPAATFLDRSFIQTIPRRQISNGLGEILKMALMKHKGLFELLESHGKYLLDTKFQSRNGLASHGDAALTAMRLAIQTMLEELAPNLWEDDLDRLVDYGHVISPELEMKVLPALMHGEAVNIDMALMTYVSLERGLLTKDEKDRTIQCMKGLELPVWHKDCSFQLVTKALGERFKHSGGKLRLPLPTGLGTAEIFNDMCEESIKRAYEMWDKECGEC
ncbi:2-epi-5-epi-valiolone synthase-like [Spea bombifrons]|uniref:2-epi-5-epi-valiolone synthase-like n=1 Tax=Spea bombifrons TaxID=233779 RepID=UPI00234A5F8E|nr:2-epi-5-epi-valiolone synthase-like [Spea bombifrons]